VVATRDELAKFQVVVLLSFVGGRRRIAFGPLWRAKHPKVDTMVRGSRGATQAMDDQ